MLSVGRVAFEEIFEIAEIGENFASQGYSVHFVSHIRGTVHLACEDGQKRMTLTSIALKSSIFLRLTVYANSYNENLLQCP